MKRAFCIMAAIMIALLSGCAKQKEIVTVPVTEGLNCKFDATYNGIQLQGNLKISGNMHMVIEVQKPDALNGMKIEINGENMKVSYLGLTTDLSLSDSKQGAFAGLIVSALKSAAASVGVNAQQTDDGYVLSGSCEMGDYTLLLDKALHPLQIKMDSQNFCVNFS